MATSSIIKEFYGKELETEPVRKQAVESSSLKEGREKLATFKFR